MWAVTGINLQMAEGDYGIELPVTISGTTLTASDTLKFVILTARNGRVILEKRYTPENNTVNLELTEEESALFPPNMYVYRLDWYQNGSFMCNIIPEAYFKVVDKA